MEAIVCFFRPKADVQKHTFWVHLKVSTKPGPVLRAGARGESWAPVVLRQWLALALSKVYRLTEGNLRGAPIPGSARTTSALDFQLHWPHSTSDAGNLPFVLVKGGVALQKCATVVALKLLVIARPMRYVLPVEWTLYANDSGENHCLALADH